MAKTTEERILLFLELNVDQIKTNLVKTTDTIITLQKQIQRGKLDLEEMGKAKVFNPAQFSELQKQIAGYEVSLKRAKGEQVLYTNQLVKIEAAQNATGDSLAQLRIKLNGMNTAFDTMTKAEQENKEVGGELLKNIQALDAQVKELEGTTGRHQRKVGDYADGFKSLRAEIKEAKDEATRLSREFGLNSEAAVKATQKVGELQHQQDEFNKRVAAFNPEAKLQAFTQAASGIAGGIGAASGAMGLFGAESEDAAVALLKVQQFMQFTQGIKQLNDLSEGLKNIKLILGATTTATVAQTTAQEANVVATEAEAAAQIENASATEAATVATEGLVVAEAALLGPLILVGEAILIAVEAYKLFNTEKDSVESLVATIETENAAHQKTADILKLRNDEAISAIETELNIAKSRGASEQDLFDIEQRLTTARKNSLSQELIENKQHLDSLQDLRNRADAKARDDDSSVEDKKKAADQLAKIDSDIGKLQIRNKEITSIEIEKLNAEATINEESLKEKQIRISEQATAIRMGLIKDEKKREIALEIESNQEKVRQLQKADGENADLISALNQQSAAKIKDINLKFAIEEVKEKSQIEIAGTLEGTDARINSEIAAAKKIRDITLTDDKLTENKKLLLIADTNSKITQLEDQRLNLAINRSKTELEQTIAIEKAKLSARQSLLTKSPEDQLAGSIDEINTNFINEQAVRDQHFDLEIQRQQSFAGRALQQEGLTEGQKQKIIDDSNKAIKLLNDQADAEGLASALKAGKDITDATKDLSDQKKQIAIDDDQLRVDAAANIEEEFTARIAQLKDQQTKELEIATLTGEQKLLIKNKFDKLIGNVEKQKSDSEIDAAKNTLNSLAKIAKDNAVASKGIAVAMALINTYQGATLALASSPPPFNFIAAAAVVAAGLADVGRINQQTFFKGGFTGEGNPKEVSTRLGMKPYTYHKREYVIDHKTLSNPLVSRFVGNVIEPMRLKNPYTLPTYSGYEVGGFTPSGSSGIDSIDIQGIVEATVAATMANYKAPNQVVIIEQMANALDRNVQINSGANVFGRK